MQFVEFKKQCRCYDFLGQIHKFQTPYGGSRCIPDVLFYIQERTELTRSTVLAILLQSGRAGEIIINPLLFLDNAVLAITEVLTGLMIEGIKYERIGAKEYEIRLLEDYDIYVGELTFKVTKKDKTIYSNLVPLDSNVEYAFARDCSVTEKQKIKCGHAHFNEFEEVEFKQVASVGDLD